MTWRRSAGGRAAIGDHGSAGAQHGHKAHARLASASPSAALGTWPTSRACHRPGPVFPATKSGGLPSQKNAPKYTSLSESENMGSNAFCLRIDCGSLKGLHYPGDTRWVHLLSAPKKSPEKHPNTSEHLYVICLSCEAREHSHESCGDLSCQKNSGRQNIGHDVL